MTNKLSEALDNVELLYSELVEVANEMTNPSFDEINNLISNLSSNIQNLSIEQIRHYILVLQLKAFEISEIREKSSLKSELAQVLQKEKFAISFNGADGTAAVREKIAQLASSQEIVTEAVYELVANLYKGKVDQLHRLVSALQSILMSRMQETKFMNMGASNDISGTTNGKVILNEGDDGIRKSVF